MFFVVLVVLQIDNQEKNNCDNLYPHAYYDLIAINDNDQYVHVFNNIVQPNTGFTCNARFTISCFGLLFLLTGSILAEHLVALGNQAHRQETFKNA